MDFGLLLGFEWIVYSIVCIFSPSTGLSLPLGSMPLASSIVSVPLVGQLYQSSPGAATSWAPHTSGPLPSWGEAPSTCLLSPQIPLPH